MRKFRIDPIDKYGNFDVDFFASEDYTSESKLLYKYLSLEGFLDDEKKFFIDFRDRKWEIWPIENKKRKKQE